jgi:hypothetical protein
MRSPPKPPLLFLRWVATFHALRHSGAMPLPRAGALCPDDAGRRALPDGVDDGVALRE